MPRIHLLTIFTRVFAIFYDALILIMTWMKTADIRRAFGNHRVCTKYSIVMYLLRDGTLYFLCLMTLNVANLIAIKFKAFGGVPAISEVATSILITRFMLNLRGVYLTNDRTSSSGSFHSSKMSDIHFASSVVGNLGAPLVHSSEAADVREDELGLVNENVVEREDKEVHVYSNPLSFGLNSTSSLTLPMTTQDEEDGFEVVYVHYEEDEISVVEIKPSSP
ncbi:hypothetical protein ABKN59_006252 [Abortiporus biennis]